MYRVRCLFQPNSFSEPAFVQMKLIPRIGHYVHLKGEELEIVKIVHTPEETDVDVTLHLKINLRSHGLARN